MIYKRSITPEELLLNFECVIYTRKLNLYVRRCNYKNVHHRDVELLHHECADESLMTDTVLIILMSISASLRCKFMVIDNV